MISILPVIKVGFVNSLHPAGVIKFVLFVALFLSTRLNGQQLVIKVLTMIGAIFLSAVLLQMGFWEGLRDTELFFLLSGIYYFTMAVIFLLTGILIFYDWWIYKKKKNAWRKTKELLKDAGRFCASATGLGPIIFLSFLIIIFESRYWGHLYLPKLFATLAANHMEGKAVLFLVLYGLAFVLPLFSIFILFLRIFKTNRLSLWFEKSAAKAMMGTSAVFIGVGAGLIFLLQS